MQTTGKLTDINIDFQSKRPKITFLLDNNEIGNLEELNGLKVDLSIKKWFKKRSLDANAYCWVLCDEIAKELSKEGQAITKENIYQDAVLQIGTFEAMIVSEKAFENFKRIWERQGLGFLVQEVSRKDKCVKVHCYYGSSTYNSKEMSLLIEYIVQNAKNLNIETKTKEEIDSLLRSWKE